MPWLVVLAFASMTTFAWRLGRCMHGPHVAGWCAETVGSPPLSLGHPAAKIFLRIKASLAATRLHYHLFSITPHRIPCLGHYQLDISTEGFLRASAGYCGFIERHRLQRYQIFSSGWAFATFAYFLCAHLEGTPVAHQSTARFIRGLFATEALSCLLGICGNTTP